MDTLTPSDDPLDQEIAAREADLSRDQATISQTESHLVQLKQNLEILTVEVRTLKRAAGLRPATASHASKVAPSPAVAPPAAPRPVAQPTETSTPTSQVGRFRDVVDQIRAGR